ncbi:hypothetical protein H4I96_05797 [Botrytis cinerea]
MAVLLGTIAIFAVITLVFTLPNSGPSLGTFTDHRMSLPKLPKQLPSPSILNPFRQAAHAPPVQKNSEYGESKWHANWNWLSPFSSSVTLDENRSLLPPLVERPTIYTYYDHTIEKDNELKDAENAVLVTWRRAWWAQGFKPIILSPAEAMNNPLYPELQRLEVENSLKTDLTRWLAWENMGTGLLCNYLTLPMGPYEDQTLSYLRRGVYPLLTRYEKWEVVSLQDPKRISQQLSRRPWQTQLSIRRKLSRRNIRKLQKEYEGNKAAGMKLLNSLMISHLHQTWQNIFTKGISVVKPEPEHMSYVVEPALQLAEYLAQCPESPMPASCPPNRPKCKACVSSSPMTISTPAFYRNTSGLYTIGTVPHPYTMSTLTSFQESINVPWIRRESPRDAWLSTLTKELLGTGVSGTPRIIKFKEAEVPSDLDWHFGFSIPRNATDTGKSETPVPGPERRPQPVHDPKDGPIPTEEDKNKEALLLEKAKAFGGSTTKEDLKIKGAVEAWNLADTEAWRFARAFLARSRVERLKWEEEEKKYAGGAGAERGKRVDGGDGLMINELIIENLTKVSAVDGCIQRKSFMFYALKRIEATCLWGISPGV